MGGSTTRTAGTGVCVTAPGKALQAGNWGHKCANPQSSSVCNGILFYSVV